MMALLLYKSFTESVRTTTVGVLERAPLCRDTAGHFEEQTSLKYYVLLQFTFIGTRKYITVKIMSHVKEVSS